MTSTIKPEVHNVSLRRQRRTETQQEVICIKKFGEDRTCSSEDMVADRQTNRQTRSSQYSAPPIGGRVINCKTAVDIYRVQAFYLSRWTSIPARDSGQELGFKVRIMFGVRSVWEQISGGQILTSNSEIVFWKVFNEIYCL